MNQASPMNRIVYFDIAKGIGILAVLVGHSQVSSALNDLIYSFHMPLFFIVSGYFISSNFQTPRTFIAKKAKYFKYYVISWGLTIVLASLYGAISNAFGGREYDVSQIIGYWVLAGVCGLGYHAQVSGTQLPSIGPMWFVLAMFWALALAEVYKGVRHPIILGGLISVLGLVLNCFLVLPFSIIEGLSASFFVALGYECKKSCYFQTASRRSKTICLCGALAYLAVCLFFNVHIDMVSSSYPLLVIDYAGSSCCSICVLLACRKLEGRIPSEGLLSSMGQKTLRILCVHNVEIDCFPWWLLAKACELIGLPQAFALLLACIRVMGAVLLTLFLDKGVKAECTKRRFSRVISNL